MGPLTPDAYQKTLTEDIQWLEGMPRSLERDHITRLLEWEREHMSAYGSSAFVRLVQERDFARGQAALALKPVGRMADLLSRILGDDGPDIDAYLDGHVEAPSVPTLQKERRELTREHGRLRKRLEETVARADRLNDFWAADDKRKTQLIIEARGYAKAWKALAKRLWEDRQRLVDRLLAAEGGRLP